MSRNKVLIYGVICWSVAAIDAAVHLASGDVVVPAAMGLTFAVWVSLRRRLAARALVEARARG